MVTQSEARQERAIAALEAASRIYEGHGPEISGWSVLNEADKFFEWLEEKR